MDNGPSYRLELKTEAGQEPRDLLVTPTWVGAGPLLKQRADGRALGVLVLDEISNAQVADARTAGVQVLRSRADLRRWVFPAARQPQRQEPTRNTPAPRLSGRPQFGTLNHDLRRFASWSGPDGARQAQKAFDLLIQHYPNQRDIAEQSLAQGRAVCAAIEKAKKSARGPDGLSRLRDYKQAWGNHTWAKHEGANTHLQQLFSRATDREFEHLIRRTSQQKSKGTSTVRPTKSPHRIDLLAPATEWTLVIDETGSNFEPEGGEGTMGRIVGALFDQRTLAKLPQCAGFHGSESTGEQVDKVLQALLDRPAGVIGLTLKGVPRSGEASLWQTGILELIEWVLRLLPRQGPTRLKVMVEQRSAHRHGENWADAIAEMRRQWTKRGLPYGDGIKVSVDVITKDGHPALPYADAVAYTWGSTKQESQARLQQSGLLTSCLMTEGTLKLAQRWDAVAAGQRLSAVSWSTLLERSKASALDRLMLRRLTEQVRNNDEAWAQYVAHTMAHLDSKRVDLRLLVRQIDWLKNTRPEVPMSGRVSLMWQIGQLATINHLGQLSAPRSAKLGEAAAAMVDEIAPVACLADLHRCVAATNAYDFETARAALTPWLERPVAIPGLRMWGRLQSSEGQLHAFLGEYTKARGYFLTALDAFGRLSDKALGAQESNQTRAYLCIAAMDDSEVDDGTVRSVLAEYLDTQDFGVVAANAEKYHHHIAVRYLLTRGTPAEREAYLAGLKTSSSSKLGHPWPLILAYQAMLQRDAGQIVRANASLKLAVDVALQHQSGPIVVLIGLCLEAVAQRWDLKLLVPNQRSQIRNWVEGLLPLAVERMKALDAPQQAPSDQALLASILPFNFR